MMYIGVARGGVRRGTIDDFSESPEAIVDLVPKECPRRKAEELKRRGQKSVRDEGRSRERGNNAPGSRQRSRWEAPMSIWRHRWLVRRRRAGVPDHYSQGGEVESVVDPVRVPRKGRGVRSSEFRTLLR